MELLPTPLSPSNTTLYRCWAMLLLFNSEGFIIKYNQVQMEDESFSIEALIFVTILALYVLTSYYINKLQLTFLHQSTVAIFLGFLTALFLKLVMDKEVIFSNELFFALILPPIVFSVGYGVKKPEFFQNFLSILFLGIVSTMVAIVLQTLILLALNGRIISQLAQRDIILISIIISSSDPISALPILKSHTHKVNAIITGQSVINSAVIIILFGTVSKIPVQRNILEFDQIVNVLADFAYVFIFSILLGIGFGLGLSYLFKKVESFSAHHIKQTSIILLTGYFVYLLGQFIGLSSIISLFTTAIVFSHYGFNNLSGESKHGTVLAFQSIRYIFQAFIFAYLGASLLTTQNKWNALVASFIIICLIPIVRFISVYFLPLLFKLFRRPFPIAKAETKLLWYSGLMRGIIAFALSLQIDSPDRTYILTATLIVVMCTTVTGATFFNRFCKLVGLVDVNIIKTGEIKEDDIQIQMVPSTKYGVIGCPEEGRESQSPNQKQKFKSFQDKFIKPIFIKQQNGNDKSLQNKKLNLTV